jgi:hypothetical protein
VVTTPDAVPDADGSVALVPVEEVIIGPAVDPAVIPKLVAAAAIVVSVIVKLLPTVR